MPALHLTLEPPSNLKPFVLDLMFRHDTAPRPLVIQTATPRPSININLGDPYCVDRQIDGTFSALPRGSYWGPQLTAFAGRPSGGVRYLTAELTPLGALRLCPGVPNAAAGLILDLSDIASKPARDALSTLHPAIPDARALPTFVRVLQRIFTDAAGGGGLLDSIGSVLADDKIGRVSDWASSVSLSDRQLRTRVTAAVGVSPKKVLRLVRFRRALFEAHPNPWAKISSHDFDYADQAHRIREFRAFAGVTPTAYSSWKKSADDQLIYTIPIEAVSAGRCTQGED
jgi:AraC-like DNA-binding protein